MYFLESFLLNILLYWWICQLIFGDIECVNNEYYKFKKAEQDCENIYLIFGIVVWISDFKESYRKVQG